MANRFFAGAILIVALCYRVIAFTLNKAPFQYDPLGPETWPRLVGIATMLCSGVLLLRPDAKVFDVPMHTFHRLVLLIVLLFAYAALFQPLGFIMATLLFCAGLGLMLGARPGPALLFGLATGVVGYFVCFRRLKLNLPGGLLGQVF